MVGQRRYGAIKYGKLPGYRTSSRVMEGSRDKERAVMMLLGDRKESVGESSLGSHSEREPLLQNIVADNAASSGGGGSGTATTSFGAGSSRRDNGKVVTTLLVLNYMIGAGILNAPQVFEKSGIGTATLLYIISAMATWLGVVVMVDAAEIVYSLASVRGGGGGVGDNPATTGLLLEEDSRGPNAGVHRRGRLEDMEFAWLARDTLGPYGSLSVDVCIVVQCCGDVASYVILIGSLTESLVEEWAGSAASGVWWSSFSVVTPVMVVLFVLPPSLIRHISNLRWLAAFSFCAILSVLLLVVSAGSIYAAEERASPDHDPGLDATITWWDWEGSVAKMGSIVFAVAYSPAALHAYTSMNPRTTTAWRQVTTWTVDIGLTMCYAMGLAGYLAFRDAVDGDILNNFEGSVASWFKVVVVAHLSIYTPFEVLVLRHSLYSLKGGDVMTAPFGHVAWITVGILVVIVALVVALEELGITQGDLFGYIIDITGGVGISATSFVLPGLIYLWATSDEVLRHHGRSGDGSGGRGRAHYAAYRRACKALVVFGILVMIFVPLGVAADIAGW